MAHSFRHFCHHSGGGRIRQRSSHDMVAEGDGGREMERFRGKEKGRRDIEIYK